MNKVTILSWMELFKYFVDDIVVTSSIAMSCGEYDITDIIPSITQLNQHDIELLKIPQFIRGDESVLRNRVYDTLDQFKQDFSCVSHIYSVKLLPYADSNDFCIKHRIVLRAVWK